MWIITNRKNTHPRYSRYCSSTISEVSSTKCLGVYLDNQLTPKRHINNIAGKFSRWKKQICQSMQIVSFRDMHLSHDTLALIPIFVTVMTNLRRLTVLQEQIIIMITARPAFLIYIYIWVQPMSRYQCLTGVNATEPRWHLPNMNVMFTR